MKPYVPWYLASKNKFVEQQDMFDEVAGNCYLITVYRSLNKKGEPVEDIIRVRHLGPLTTELLNIYVRDKGLSWYVRDNSVIPDSAAEIVQRLQKDFGDFNG